MLTGRNGLSHYLIPETPDQVADPNAKRTDYYQQVRHEVLALVPADARRILDVGCAEGMPRLRRGATVPAPASRWWISPFGRVSLKDLRQEEVVELCVIQYLLTATRR